MTLEIPEAATIWPHDKEKPLPPETLPILPSWDFNHTAGFYTGLGFEEEERWPGRYLIMRHPVGIELHFFSTEAFPTSHNHHGVYVRFETAADSDALFESWSRTPLDPHHLSAPQDTDYGLREFALTDPMGNLLRIGGFTAGPGSAVGEGRRPQ